eukprot:scaffold54406_cov18-Tisochrysis_lutea.AAC.1
MSLLQEWAQAAKITLLTSTEVEAISRTTGQQSSSSSSSSSSGSSDKEEAPLCVKAVRRNSSGNSETIELRPHLLIGADGLSGGGSGNVETIELRALLLIRVEGGCIEITGS